MRLESVATAGLVETFGDIRQLGYVVADIDAAIAAWSRALAVGPWTVIRNLRLPSVYRGRPSRPVINVALSFHGETQIELIRQRDDAPSPYRRKIEAGEYGLHHAAFLCDDIDGDIERAESLGWSVVCDIKTMDGGRYAYLQSPRLGAEVYVEFLQNTLMMRLLFKRGIAAARRWRGGGRPLEIDLRNGKTLLASLWARLRDRRPH